MPAPRATAEPQHEIGRIVNPAFVARSCPQGSPACGGRQHLSAVRCIRTLPCTCQHASASRPTERALRIKVTSFRVGAPIQLPSVAEQCIISCARILNALLQAGGALTASIPWATACSPSGYQRRTLVSDAFAADKPRPVADPQEEAATNTLAFVSVCGADTSTYQCSTGWTWHAARAAWNVFESAESFVRPQSVLRSLYEPCRRPYRLQRVAAKADCPRPHSKHDDSRDNLHVAQFAKT